MRFPLFKTLVLSLTLCSLPNLAQAEQWKATIGGDYGTGKYGAIDETKLTYIPVSIAYKTGAWTSKVTAAWLQNEGPGSVIGGGEGGIVIPGLNAVSKENGIGDTWVSLKYEVESFPMKWGYLDLTGKLKLPTADEKKGLGTGENDYTLQADYAYSMDKLTPMFTIAYKIKGDPKGVKLDNVFYLSAGFDYRHSDTTHLGFSLDHQEASTPISDDALEIFSYLSLKLEKGRSVMPYAYFGLSDGSPDKGIGFQLSQKF